jgi:group I intron endonuclease
MLTTIRCIQIKEEILQYKTIKIMIQALKLYENAKIQKQQILSENKGKSGIYKWINKINGKFYIGSAVDLKIRLAYYYSVPISKKSMENSLKKSKSAIYSAILKHGQSNFKLEILEYCSDISKKCVKLEQKHINLLKPSYNILPIAGSRLGSIVSGETRAKISASKKGENNPMFGYIKTRSEETRAQISAALLGIPKSVLCMKLRLRWELENALRKLFGKSQLLIREILMVKINLTL